MVSVVDMLCNHRNGDYSYPLSLYGFHSTFAHNYVHTWIGYEINLDLLHAHEKDADHSILTVIYSIV